MVYKNIQLRWLEKLYLQSKHQVIHPDGFVSLRLITKKGKEIWKLV